MPEHRPSLGLALDTVVDDDPIVISVISGLCIARLSKNLWHQRCLKSLARAVAVLRPPQLLRTTLLVSKAVMFVMALFRVQLGFNDAGAWAASSPVGLTFAGCGVRSVLL